MSIRYPNSVAGRLALAVVLAIGVAGVWLTLAGWASMVFSSTSGVYDSLVFTPDGEPIVQRYTANSVQSRSYHGIDGQPREFADPTWLSQAIAAGDPSTSGAAPLLNNWQTRLLPLNDGTMPAGYWYFILDGEDHRSGYLVGYDSASRRKIGYIDASGFHTDSLRQPFRVPYNGDSYWLCGVATSQSMYSYGGVNEPVYYSQVRSVFPGWRAYVIDGDKLKEVDLRQRDKPHRTLLEQPGMLSAQIHGGYQPALTMPAGANAQEADTQKEAMIIATREEVLVYDPATAATQAFRRPAELVGNLVYVYRPINGGLVMHLHQRQPSAPSLVYTFAADGSLVARREVRLSNPGQDMPAAAPVLMSAAAPMPLVAVFAVSGPFAWGKMLFEDSLSFGEAFRQAWLEFWLYPALTIVVSLVLAGACYRRQRRYADSVIWPWVVLILLLGVPGYLGYRLHRYWPIHRLCPTCRMPTPRDRQECVDCGADWPQPEVKGVEVYA